MNPMAPPMGGKNPGAQMERNHLHASAMASAAAKRMKVAKALSGGGVPPPSQAHGGAPPGAPGGDYRAHIGGVLGTMGVPAPPPVIHAAIDSLAAKGRFTPFQAAALKAHQGPLVGPQGAQTMHDIATEVLHSRMGQGPTLSPGMAGGGLPPGMGG